MTIRLRLVLISGCALLCALEGPTAGTLLAQGLAGPYPDGDVHAGDGALIESVAPGRERGEARSEGRAARALVEELDAWHGGIARGL